MSITESINATAQNPQTTTWSGTMVSGGTIEVRTTVNGTEYVQTMNVTVNDRTWGTEVPITTDTTSWGTEAPGQHSDLGDVEYDMPFTPADDLETAEVSSGPNKGILYIASLNLTAPLVVRINRHFGVADADLPPCWVAFKEANTRYGEIEGKVKARLGFDGTTSGTLYGSWEDEIHFSDPKANLEEFMEVPGYLSYYETQIVNYVEYIRRTRKAGMDRAKSGWSPSGITINYNYFVADAGDDQTVDVNTPVTFDGSASCVPAGRTIAAYAWDFGDGNTATGVQATHTYNTPGVYPVTLIATDDQGNTATDTLTLTAFQLVVDSDNTDDSLVFPDDPPSDSASGTNGEGGTDGASGASGASGGSGARSEPGTTTKSTTPPPSAQLTFILKPVDANITTGVHFDIYPSNTEATRVKRFDDVAGTGNTFSTSWDGTNNDGERVPNGDYQVIGTATYFASNGDSYTSSAAHTVTVSSGSIQVRILTTSDDYLVGGQDTTGAVIWYEIDPPESVLPNAAKIRITKDGNTVLYKTLPTPTEAPQPFLWNGKTGGDEDNPPEFVTDASGLGYGVYDVTVEVERNPLNPTGMPYKNAPAHQIKVFGIEIAMPNEDDVFLVGDEISFAANIEPSSLSSHVNQISWSFTTGSGNPASGTGGAFSSVISSAGEVTIKAEIAIGGHTAEDEIDVTVVKLTLDGEDSVTRGDSATLTATLLPLDLSPDPMFSWISHMDLEGGVVVHRTKEPSTSPFWSGRLVTDTRIEVTAIIGEITFTTHKQIEVTSRSGWDDSFQKLPTQNRGQGDLPNNPTVFHHLARSVLDYPDQNISMDPITAGPNEDLIIVQEPPTETWLHWAFVNSALTDEDHAFHIANVAAYDADYMEQLHEMALIHEGIELDPNYSSHLSQAQDALALPQYEINPWAESYVKDGRRVTEDSMLDEVGDTIYEKILDILAAYAVEPTNKYDFTGNRKPVGIK